MKEVNPKALPFGCRCFFLEHDPKLLRLKFKEKSRDGIFVGYAQHGGAQCLDIEELRQGRHRVVVTRDATYRPTEVPAFFERQLAADTEAALNMLFALRGERDASTILSDGNEKCRLCDLAILGGVATCLSCRGLHRPRIKDQTCVKGRCGGHSRAEILRFIEENPTVIPYEQQEAVRASQANEFIPQKDGDRKTVRFGGADNGGLEKDAPPSRILGKQRTVRPGVARLQEEIDAESDDDFFQALRDLDDARGPKNEIIEGDDVEPRNLDFGDPSAPPLSPNDEQQQQGQDLEMADAAEFRSVIGARISAPGTTNGVGLDLRRVVRDATGLAAVVHTPFGTCFRVKPEAAVAEMPNKDKHLSFAGVAVPGDMYQLAPELEGLGPAIVCVTRGGRSKVEGGSTELRSDEGR